MIERIKTSSSISMKRIHSSNMKFQVALCVILSVSIGASPPWKKCPPSDPNVEECLKGAIEGAVKDLAHGSGIGLVDIEPIKYEKVTLIDANTGAFRGKLIYTDVFMNGFSNMEVKKVEKRPGVIGVELYLPKTNITGKYIMDTVLLAVPMKGDGDFTLNLGNLTMNFEFTLKKKLIGGITAWDAKTNRQPVFKLEYLQIHHTNLFNGNKALGDGVNKILNQNWKILAKELGSIIVRAFGPVYVKVANDVLNKLSAHDFPELA